MADAGNAVSSAGIAPSEPAGVQIKRALISVSDKTGIVEFAHGLRAMGVEIVSTGGTARELAQAGLDVRAVEDFTGFPEIMDGRVKTLHPRLYAGLLALRDNPGHLRAAAELEIEPVDLVCVNLYPFERTVARGDASDAEIIENIDIGGPTMIRAAAKNHAFAAVVVDPSSYDAVLEELANADGRLSLDARLRLAGLAFTYTARYDAAISSWFALREEEDFPATQARAYEKVSDLRYGENPHQRGAYYARVGAPTHLLAGVVQRHGKELSFNNLLDLSAARELVEEFDEAACVIVKHNNPCGCALGASALIAYEHALACDPMSAFGGVVAINRRIDRELAQLLAQQFIEVLLAPGFDEDALALLQVKAGVRLLELPGLSDAGGEAAGRESGSLEATDAKQVIGGLLLQDRDSVTETRSDMTVTSARAPSEQEWQDLLFAWNVCRHVRSNAIVLVRDRHGRHRRRADEPCRCRAHRCREGPGGSAAAAGGELARL
jgi:phosphoribosylaminoimidazolecarboxamide formyltransferase/IMP cyclohydrolase